ncbi:putative oxidoreductase YciK [Vibrio aerogenes CECT 7868]|uniref:Putative oxidoreductase YciK n=1 Tax=Vibrio aerogenes CECT 7868 TaxID=1216006 RepID=A0A1M6DBG7_9VIBR|nr:YciK family oxidoreductase [Vibrio aerogenes]SHI70500.1 putative oxidoreductase YciK [Vibrio aerogenes CECT 7868]
MTYSVKADTLKDRIILITGASDGIGKQAAISYAQHGATVILTGRSMMKLEDTARKIHDACDPQASVITLDMMKATRQDYLSLAKVIESEYGRLDGLLHSAGQLGDICPFESIEEQVYDEVMQVNVKAQFLLTQALLPLLKQSEDSRLIFTSSTVGHEGRAHWGTYAVSKFATEGMMQVLADELKETKVRVNAINPGGTRTGMRAKAFPQENPGTLKTPLDIIPLYLYLMAPEGIEVHGQCIDAQKRKPAS